jgi:CRISPR/Cas system CMR-associated protein Cmr5 small subunit
MTRQQQWAKEALARVKQQHGKPKESKYRTLCMKLPSLLKQSGILQSLAFMRARDEIGKQFCDELAQVYGVPKEGEQSAGEVLQKRAQRAELNEYLVLSRDLIAVSVWFRRFAQAELRDSDETPTDSAGGINAG